MSRDSVFWQPLAPGDTSTETIGCRHTNPDICGKNGLYAVCAFIRDDGMCLQPPRSWAKQYQKLLEQKGERR